MSFLLSILAIGSMFQALPTDEARIIAYLAERNVVVSKNAQGQAVKLMSSGKTPMTAADYALIGNLTTLEEVGINGAPLKDGEWGFLKSLPNLKKLSIWHGHAFASLEPFSGLPVESLTIGGCLGLRELNKADASRLRNAIMTLHDLPNLEKGNWYHSPLAPDDTHLAHIASHFGKLRDLRLDFAAPPGSKTTVTPKGLAVLQSMPLTTLSIESVDTFTADHFLAIAGIKTLKTLLVDARKKPVSTEALAAFQKVRPEVEVTVADASAKGPPTVQRVK